MGSPAPCSRCMGDAVGRCTGTGEGMHRLRTLPHPAPPPWLHDQIMTAIASEAQRRQWLAGDPLNGKGGNDVGHPARPR